MNVSLILTFKHQIAHINMEQNGMYCPGTTEVVDMLFPKKNYFYYFLYGKLIKQMFIIIIKHFLVVGLVMLRNSKSSG